jgi:hypothetical protein
MHLSCAPRVLRVIVRLMQSYEHSHHNGRRHDRGTYLLLCNFGSILKQFWSTFQSHHCKEGHVRAFLLTMQLWIHSEAFLDLFRSISEHLCKEKDMYQPFYWLCNFGSILKQFWSTFQSHHCKEGHLHAFLLTMQLWIHSEAFLDLFQSFSEYLCKKGHLQAFLLTMQLWIYSQAVLKHFLIISL